MQLEDNQHGDFSSSLTDLMASIAVVFLLIAAAMITLVRITQDENSKSTKTCSRKQNKSLAKKSELFMDIAKILDVKIGPNEQTYNDDCYSIDAQEEFRLRIRFKEANENSATRHGVRCRALTFVQNKFALNLKDPQIKELLSKLSRIFTKTCDQKSVLSRVSLEGHTDQIRYTDIQSQCRDLQGG
ncbi:MAG: hypothetical protein IPK04_15890 [Bdellovibrionales bacterium]|nr:hypothetical protein [Bdellovibrionales bacterium]